MEKAPLPANEKERLATLKEYKILDTPCEEIFDNITKVAAQICHVPISLISLVDSNRQFLKSNHGLDIKQTTRETSFCSHVILGPDLMEVPDASKDKRFNNNPYVLNEPNIHFYAGMPLKTRDGFNLGTLCVIDNKPKKLTTEQKSILTSLSQVVMTVFELKKSLANDVQDKIKMNSLLQTKNIQLEEGLDEQKLNNHTLALFSQMNGMLQSCVNLQEAYAVIRNFCQKIFSASSGTLYLMSSSRDYLERVLSWKEPASTMEFFSLDDCWALRRGQYYVINNSEVDVICNHYKKNNLKNSAQICLPLIAQSDTLGLLCIENILLTSNNETQILYAVRMAEQIALCLANIKLKQILVQQSTKDALTGLYNRRYLADVFKREIAHAARNKSQLGVMIIDIDFFKKFNDTYGHDVGDMVLKALSDLLLKNIREYDIACRLGGEEFLVLLRGLSTPNIIERAEELRNAAQQILFKYQGKEIKGITISVGIGIYPLHGESFDQIAKSADEALYQAKNAGRNQVKLAENKETKVQNKRPSA